MKTIVRSVLFAVLLLGGAAAHAQATVTVVRTNGSTSTITGGTSWHGLYSGATSTGGTSSTVSAQ